MIRRAAVLGSLVAVRSFVAVLGSVATVGSLPSAHAQEPPIGLAPAGLSVTWEGPPECGNARSLEVATRKLLSKLADSTDVEVVGRATRMDETRYRVDLYLSGAITGTRSFESAECRDAVQAAAVVLALAINPDALSSSAEKPADDPEMEPDPQPQPQAQPQEPEGEPPERARAPVFGFIEIAARASSGLTPFPSWGTEFSGGIDYNSLRVRLGGFVTPHESVTLEPSGEARFFAAGGGVDACWRAFELAAFTLRGCLGMWLSWVRASSTGLDESRSRPALLYSPRALLELSFRLHPHLSFTFAGGAQVPTTSVRFQVDDATVPTTVHEVTPGGVGRAGVELHF